MKIICSMDQVLMLCINTGVTVVKLDEMLAPYELWSADEFECPACHARVLDGFAEHPFNKRFAPDFEQNLRSLVLRPDNLVFAIYTAPLQMGPFGPDQLRRHLRFFFADAPA